MGKPPSVPDLELPSGASSKRPAARDAGAVPAARDDDDDLFGGGIERGISAAPPTPANPHHAGKAVSIEFGNDADDDPFGDAIERGAGGGSFSAPPSPTSKRPPLASGAPPVSRAPASLDLAYKPSNVTPKAEEPDVSFAESLGARAVPLVGCIAVVAAALKFLHRPGRFAIGGLLPRALDATSTVQSGVFTGVALILAIGVGYYGFKTRPRSWAIVVSGGLLLLASLAMVTVTLISLEENPSPADGARLIPYVVPLAVVLFGLGITSRGYEPFLDGGARRALSFGLGLLGGAIVYAGLALSAF